jgi:replicative DNA helicase
MHIDRLQLIMGIQIDLVIVDYADILRPFTLDKNQNSYNESGGVYEELRQILGELQIPGWTASQSNRSAHEEEIIEAGNVADSYRKIMTGDFILSLSRKMEDKLAGTGRVHVMKNRFGPDGVTYPCAFDTSCGKIDILDPKSAEGMELLNKSKNAEDNIKEILRKKWNETHDDNGTKNTN